MGELFEFRLPDLGEGLVEGTVTSWYVAVGDTVALNQPLLEVETAKLTAELPSPAAGTIHELHARTGEVVAVGERLVTIDAIAGSVFAAPATEAASAATSAPAAAPPRAQGAKVLARPAVRRRAQELGVDLGTVNPTGPGGEVTATDVDAAAAGQPPT
jgi:pyruvate dehydrogenase E2 component (dihydrolipoamide acetyltransferase)